MIVNQEFYLFGNSSVRKIKFGLEVCTKSLNLELNETL